LRRDVNVSGTVGVFDIGLVKPKLGTSENNLEYLTLSYTRPTGQDAALISLTRRSAHPRFR
jgi:hypothetical protein